MVGNEVNFPIQLLINYWEIRPALMGARLDELMRHGISHVTTFIPWQAVESDIAHSLTRFLQAAAERRIAVSLILSPEVGIHHPSSGLPKDVISRQDNMAKHIQGGGITVNLPPGSVSLPSFFASEFSKRYYSYLSRMDGFFADVAKQPGNLLENVTVVTTGSLWKYYRSPAVSAASTFGGTAGDYSGNAGLIYRQSVEQFYAQREFVDPTPVAANRWKTRQMDETNRRWFYQQSEDVFRNRTQQALRKKATAINFKEIELFTPEADPSFFLLQLSSDDVRRAFRLREAFEFP